MFQLAGCLAEVDVLHHSHSPPPPPSLSDKPWKQLSACTPALHKIWSSQCNLRMAHATPINRPAAFAYARERAIDVIAKTSPAAARIDPLRDGVEPTHTNINKQDRSTRYTTPSVGNTIASTTLTSAVSSCSGSRPRRLRHRSRQRAHRHP